MDAGSKDAVTQTGRALREPCANGHGMVHRAYTRDDDGKRVELRCEYVPDCTFRVTYLIKWPDALKETTPSA